MTLPCCSAIACALRRGGSTLVGIVLTTLLAAPASGQIERDPAFAVPAAISGQAAFSCNDVRLVGQSHVSSVGLGGTGHGVAGHVVSNGNIDLTGGAQIWGDATAGPGKQVRRVGNSKVHGQIGNLAAPRPCQPVDLAALQTRLLAANDNHQIPLTDRGLPALSGGDGRALRLTGQDGVTLPAGTYLFSTIELTGQSKIRLGGEVHILVTGNIMVTGQSRIHDEGNPYQLRLWSRGANLDINSVSFVNALVYAPNANTILTGQSWLRGALFASRFELTGNARLHRLVDDAVPTLEVDHPLDGAVLPNCTPTVSGRASDAEGMVSVTVNGIEAPLDPDGEFALALELPSPFSGTVRVEATDAAGNVVAIDRHVSIAAPEPTLISPAPGSLLGAAIVALSGARGGATMVAVDGIEAALDGAGWSIPAFDLGADGLHTLEIVGTHCGGSTTVTAVLDLDTQAPTIAIDTPPAGVITADPTVVVSGPVEDAHLESVVVNGVAATVTAGRFNATVALVEGGNSIVAVATDALGRSASSTALVVVRDSTAPVVRIDVPVSGSVIATPTIAVAGIATDDNLTEVRVNGLLATLDGDAFTVAEVPLVEGTNQLVAVARDTVGLETSSVPVVVVLDTLPPEVAIDPESVPALTAASSITVRGTAADPHLFEVQVGDVVATVVEGEWVAVDVPLAEGANELVATATDSLGHSATSTPVTVVRDGTPPEVAISEPADGAELASTTVLVRGTAVDAHLAGVTVGEIEAVMSGETFEVELELPEGGSELVARAVDELGQAAFSAAVNVVVDSLPPQVALDTVEPSLLAATTVDLAGTALDPHLESVVVGELTAILDGERFQLVGVPLEEGENSFVAVALDRFGHQATSEPVLVVRDTLPPVLEVSAPVDGQVIVGGVVVVVGTATDPHLDRVLVQGELVSTDADGRFEITLPVAGNLVVIEAVDQLGHTSTVARTVLSDSEPPLVSIDTPVLAAATCLAGGLVELGGIYVDASPVTGGAGQPPPVALSILGSDGLTRQVSASLDAGGRRWSAVAELGAVDGVATVTATAHDALGNHSTVLRAFPIDATAPVVELTVDGTVFAGTHPGATPNPALPPVLFGRGVALGVVVRDGAAGTPPVGRLEVNGTAWPLGAVLATEGEALVVARTSDCAGRERVVHARLEIDLSPPRLLTTSPAEGAILGVIPSSFSGSSDPDLAGATVAGRPATISGGGSFALAHTDWGEGENVVAVELVDRAGHRSSFTRRFTVASVPPKVEVLVGGLPIAPNALFLAPVTPEIRPNPGDLAVTATLNGAPFVLGTTISVGGSYTLVAAVVDALGRTAEATATFRLDLEDGPAIEIAAPSDGARISSPTVEVSGVVSGSAPLTVTVGGRPATVAGNTFTLAGVELAPDEPTTIEAIVRDGAGRTAAVAITVLHASAGPHVLILEPADGAGTNRAAIDVAGVVVGGPSATVDGRVVVSGPAGSASLELDPRGGFRAVDVALEAGANVVVVEAVDAEGRIGRAEVEVFVDAAPPSIVVEANGAPLADGATFGAPIALVVTITDDSQALAEPSLRLNGEVLAAASAITELTVDEDGGYLLSVVARDQAGNESRLERSFVLDRGACVVAGLDPAPGSTVAADSVSLRGRSGAAAAVAIRVPGFSDDFVAELASGTFLAGSVPLPNLGENLLQVVCVDAAGVEHLQPWALTRLASGAGPTVEITSPADGALLAAGSIGVGGSTGASATQVTVNGLPANLTAEAFAIASMPLVEGPNVLRARAVDGAGRSGTDRVVVQRDSQAPRLSITAPESGARLGLQPDGSARVDVSGVVDLSLEPHLAAVVVSGSAGPVPASVDPLTGAFVARDVTLDPAAGPVEQALVATATDLLGQAGTATTRVIVDAGGPLVVLHQPADGGRYLADATVEVSGEVWAAEGAQVALNGTTIDPALLEWAPAAADGRRHATFAASLAAPATDGPFGVIAQATELDGRSARARRLLHRDGTGPKVIELYPLDGETAVDPDRLMLVLFDEPVAAPSLAAADGLRLIRQATGESVVAQSTIAGTAVALTPGAALAAGESYRLRAGSEITDLAGNLLQLPQEVTFVVAAAASAAAPILDPLPPVVCAETIAIRGSATPNVSVRVRLGELVFNTVADTDGRFELLAPVVGEGFVILRASAIDASGASSPEASLTVRVDCGAPKVLGATFDRHTAVIEVIFDEAMDPLTLEVGAATSSIRLSDAEEPDAGLFAADLELAVDGRSLRLELDPDPAAWWRDRPVRLQVAAPAADVEGNPLGAPFETVFFPGGGGDVSGGFLIGEVYDDTTGRPLEGVSAHLYPSGVALPGVSDSPGAAVTSAVSDGRGRFTMVGEIAAGRYVLVLEHVGFTRVVRHLAIEPGRGVVPFDSRLTPRADALGVLEPAVGGAVGEVPGPRLEADAGALAGADPLEVVLTALSGQGLPGLLPLGWSPAAVHELVLIAGGEVLPEATSFTGVVELEVDLAAWVDPADELVAVRFDPATGAWVSLEAPLPLAGGRVRLVVPGPGSYAVIVPDGFPDLVALIPAGPGEVLLGLDRPALIPALTADIELDPPVVPPTGRSRARVLARSEDGASAWPSGLAVQAYLEEKLILAGGAGQLLEAPFAVDLVLYHERLTPAELGGADPAATGVIDFAVSPSARAATVLLDIGWEKIRLFPFPEEVERGQVVGPTGGSIVTRDELELVIPEGALAAQTVVDAELLPELPAVAGYTTLAAIRLDFAGATLARPATLRAPASASTPPAIPGDPRLVLVEWSADLPGHGADVARLASLIERLPAGPGRGERLEAAPAHAGVLPLDGIVREGIYLLLAADGSIGFASGAVRLDSGVGIEGIRVETPGLGTADLSRLGGRYVVPVLAGASRDVLARHNALGREARAEVSLAPAQVAFVDLVLVSAPPVVVDRFPAPGATEVPIGASVSILFDRPLDPSSVGSGTLRLELIDGAGGGTGAFVLGEVTLTDADRRIVFAPQRPLPTGRPFRARFSGGVRATTGAFYLGESPLEWSFQTSAILAPGGQVDPRRFVLRVPVNGVAELIGLPGALPSIAPGGTPWVVFPEVEGPRLDPLRPSFQGQLDGSFAGTVGRLPSYGVTIESRVWVKVFDPTGELAAHFRLGPFVTPDGRGFVAPAGEAVEFESVDGVVVEVPAAAFDRATLVRVTPQPASVARVPTPAGMAAATAVELDFEGRAKETLRLHVPAPVGIDPDAQAFVGVGRDFPWGRRLVFTSVGGVLERDGRLYLSNDPSLQPEPEATAGATAGLLKSVKAVGHSCRDARDAGLPRCFLQSLLMEFQIRSLAVWYYEAGVDIAMMTGFAQPFSIYQGLANEAITNLIADNWVYVPVPYDWSGGFVLPVLSGEPLEIGSRDIATGWITSRRPYDPITGDDGLIDVGFLEEPTTPPRLVDATPFDVLRFAAPERDTSERIRLELLARGDAIGRVELVPADGYPLADGTSLGLWDFAPTAPADPEAEPEPPRSGPQHLICGDGETWSVGPMAPSDDMVVVVGPGDVDPRTTTQLELQFDLPLADLSARPVDQVARLLDLGPIDCAASSAAPRALDITIEQHDRDSRLVIVPQGQLPPGRRLRLELEPAALAGSSGVAAWESAPRRFDFATLEVPGEVVADTNGGTAAAIGRAIDMARLGNLVMVGAGGEIVALDSSDPIGDESFGLHAIKNSGIDGNHRAFATDGHGRLFHASQFGHLWALKALRLEDVAGASAADCLGGAPEWASGKPCFSGIQGSVRISYAPGTMSGLTASEWLALGAMPQAIPMRLEILVQDEKGAALELGDFAVAYTGGTPPPSADGRPVRFDVPVRSTVSRAQAGLEEPSLPGVAPGFEPDAWRRRSCSGEEAWDRYQRVTVDNLTTGQSWSVDVENSWPEGGGDGTGVVPGVTARPGDQLRVRYNLRALGYVAMMGSGITVTDLNRFYGLTQSGQSPGGGQCGRRLGTLEGQQVDLPDCVAGLVDGLAMTPSVAVHSQTGCGAADEPCRGDGRIDIYSPLQRFGVVHSASSVANPGGSSASSIPGEEGLQVVELAACIGRVDGSTSQLRDVALANDIVWLDRGLRGALNGVFSRPDPPPAAELVEGDLLAVSLGMAGVFVFDVSHRSVGPATLVGHLRVPNHSAARVQVDPLRGVLLAGGTDYSGATPRPVIDVWDLAAINGAPGHDPEPRPLLSLDLPWTSNRLALDGSGLELIYTWDETRGLVAAPLGGQQFTFHGLYRAPEEESQEQPQARATARFAPLGVPLRIDPAAELADREQAERDATAAFKLRIALPGSLGEELSVRVQSLRALPADRFLGREDLGPAVALPGGPGWPDPEVAVRLRRLSNESLELGYHLYESVETVVLVADPRASEGYERHEIPGSEADEESQCRRCERPEWLGEGDDVVELLAGGRHLRAYLAVDSEAPAQVQQNTEAAIDFFTTQGRNYPLPFGRAEVAGTAAALPSPFQVALAEPAHNAAVWEAGEAGVSATLAGGELLLGAIDHGVAGRALPFTFERFYRSGALGYGPLGSAGWSSPLFARLRELETTGEVEYHDGTGRVWRFLPATLAEIPEGWEEDPAGSYHVPAGLYLRLQKLPGGLGWRLIGRHHDLAVFDGEGRLIQLGDRHSRGRVGEDGSSAVLGYDVFGQLVWVEDDLGRRYRFEYHNDPAPVAEGGDGPRYGLLEKIVDFDQREIEYRYDTNRRLIEVRLPEVENPVSEYAEFSYTGGSRPRLAYGYDPQAGVSSSPDAIGAPLHGDFAELRLAEVRLPDFVEEGPTPPRARFEYESATGRLRAVGFPTPSGANAPGSSVVWSLDSTGAGAAGPSEVTVRAPWGHEVELTLEDGRVVSRREELLTHTPGEAPSFQQIETHFTHAEDGRLTAVDRPDGSRLVRCFADGAGCGGDAADGVDRLAIANVVTTTTVAGNQAAQGSADYTEITTAGSYDGSNLLSSLTDGESRPIELAVPSASATAATRFVAEGVSARFEYDRHARPVRLAGGGDGGAVTTIGYGEDARGRTGAGLVERIERGEGDAIAGWQELDYDSAWNVTSRRTSQGSREQVVYDRWDRPVRETSGLVEDERIAPVGGPCPLGQGSIVERAFDAAGHVVRERRLQDVVGEGGAATCRFVERRYRWNAREELVSVEETHLASATEPAVVVATAQPVASFEYDEHGRLELERAPATVAPEVVTRHRYDEAGRLAGTTLGAEGERQVGYDSRGRVVFASDGDEGTWRGRYDAWDRLWLEESATGAFTHRRFDRAGNPLSETVFDRDPTSDPENAVTLAGVETLFTSFGAPERIVERLTEAGDKRIVEHAYDESGRLTAVWSGPEGDTPGRVDASQARRELEREHEPITGRVSRELAGGLFGEDALVGTLYEYHPDALAPWPSAVRQLEAVPGIAELLETTRTEWRYDAFGRAIHERRDDGSELWTVYDRSGGPIRVRTGAGAESTVTTDGRGQAVRTTRPFGRGASAMAYERDGRLLREVTTAGGETSWETVYHYDSTGRPTAIDYADGTREESSYYQDSTLATRTGRDGVEVSFSYDAANRPIGAVPVAGVGETLVDAGDGWSWDQLSRPTVQRRGRPGVGGFDPSLEVGRSGYDLGSRVGTETVGGRAMSWSWDSFGRPVEVTLPVGAGRGGGTFQGFGRSYDSRDRLTDVAGLGAAGLSPTAIGARWSWGGDRLYAMDTKGVLGTGSRWGWHDGAGPQLPNAPAGEASRWKLATLSWGAGLQGGGAGAATTQLSTSWVRFGYGWRGHEGEAADGAKVGRLVMPTASGVDLGSGLGWSWGYDAGVRLSSARAGIGSLDGSGGGGESWRFAYREGDELERIVREATGEVAELESGVYGRILARDGVAFAHDGAGRRTLDDRFRYRWNWRGELVEVEVLDEWPGGEVTPWAGHLIEYRYDATGRMAERWHWGAVPEGGGDRPFIERRVFVWEEARLAAEAAYGLGGEETLRWRRTYVPGPSGLDDAPQVVVEIGAIPGNPFSGTTRTYTYLRDELGTVIGLIAEDEGSDPSQPPAPVRYRYSPYGEAHAEVGPRLEAARFAEGIAGIESIDGTAASQNLPGGNTAAAGALVLTLSAPLDPATLAAGLVVERLDGTTWTGFDVTMGHLRPPPGTIGNDEPDRSRLILLPSAGWPRDTSYRVRLGEALRDHQDRALAERPTLQWAVPAATGDSGTDAVGYQQAFPVSFETWRAAGDQLGGRFPSGQNSLFQGLWTDPVTGIAHARARWYDARNATWLSEDPLKDVDSVNLYAFVGWGPHAATDPLGECLGLDNLPCSDWYLSWLEANAKTAVTVAKGLAEGAVKTADVITLGQFSGMGVRAGTFLGTGGTLEERARAANEAANEHAADVVTLGFYSASDKAEHAKNLIGGALGVDAQREGSAMAFEGIIEGDGEKALLGGAQWLGGASQTVLAIAGLGRGAQAVRAAKPAVASPAGSGVRANKLAGDSVRDVIAAREAPALTEVTIRTHGGLRRLDVLKLGEELVGIESKVGRTSLGPRGGRVRQELARDWWSRRRAGGLPGGAAKVDKVRWEFTRSQVTDQVGPTPSLRDKLVKLGFEIVVNE